MSDHRVHIFKNQHRYVTISLTTKSQYNMFFTEFRKKYTSVICIAVLCRCITIDMFLSPSFPVCVCKYMRECICVSPCVYQATLVAEVSLCTFHPSDITNSLTFLTLQSPTQAKRKLHKNPTKAGIKFKAGLLEHFIMLTLSFIPHVITLI